MSEDFDKLKAIGAQKIYEKTHIARASIELILNKSFDKLPKVQFRGFIAILERDYKVNLQDILAEFEAHTAKDEEIVQYIKIDTKEYGKFDKKVIVAALLATLLVGYFIISSFTHSSTEVVELNNSEIETAKANIERNESVVTDVNSSEINTSAENNVSTVAPVVTKPTATTTTKFEIIPGKKLWFAYVDMQDFKQTQMTIRNNFDLNASKNYLLEMGHGILKMDFGGEIKEFNENKKKYFKFENGTLNEISRDEFKNLNKGKAW
jgi:hypothetical protein